MEGPSWAFGLRLRTHARYLRYVLLHKWWVLRWGLRLKVPLGQLLVHDMSKFSRAEWGPYARWFYTRAPDGREWYVVYKEAMSGHPGCVSEPHWTARHLKADFDEAWKHHWEENLHHAECWANGLNSPIKMPEVHAREMVADWCGAGYAKGKRDIRAWYEKARDGMRLHPDTRVLVESLLREFVYTR